MCRISLKDHRRNDEIRKLDGVVNISEKAEEGRFVARACNEKRPESGVRRAPGTPLKEKRSQGRQKLRWINVVQRYFKQKRIVDGTWKDRNQWRKVCRAADPD